MKSLRLRVEPPLGEPWEHECGGAVVLGRAADADLVCNDASMSRRHARVFLEDDTFFLEDLGARNGTFLNGQRVQGRARLADGDLIKLGGTRIIVNAPAAAGGTTRPAAPPAGMLGNGQLGSSIFRRVSDLVRDDLAGAEMQAAPARVAARLKALNDFHRAMAGAIALPVLLEQLLDGLFAALRPEEGVILLRQSDGTLRTAASRRLPGARGELLVSSRLTQEVVGRNTAALVTDVSSDERFAAAQSVVASGIRSILAAPFTDAEGCLGMVAIYSRTSVRRFGEEDLELLVSLASAAALRIRNVALSEEAAARRVQDRELALAHDIQMDMLPKAMPARADLEVAATLIPARAVGGDLYDFFLAGDDLWFIVADAAGKGVSAALFMAIARTLFRASVTDASAVASVVERMNAGLARDNERQVFVTALVGRLALPSGELTWCAAGHPPPLRATSDGLVEPLVGSGDAVALGIVEDAVYHESRVTLAPGDTLLIYTDGVTEAVNQESALFGDERLAREFGRLAAGDVDSLVQGIVTAVTTFAAGVPQEDDVTVVGVRRKKKEERRNER